MLPEAKFLGKEEMLPENFGFIHETEAPSGPPMTKATSKIRVYTSFDERLHGDKLLEKQSLAMVSPSILARVFRLTCHSFGALSSPLLHRV